MIEIIGNKNKKTSLQQEYGRPIVTKALCNEANSNTKIQINPNRAKQNLQDIKNLISRNPNRLCSLRGLYTNICEALGINGVSASHYGCFIVNGEACSIRISNHNSNANTYGCNFGNNISLKVRPRNDKNRFVSSENVTLEEFVYFDYMISKDRQLVLDIIDSIIEYLSTGEFIDKSQLAKKNYSPDLPTISHQRVQQTLRRKDLEDEINQWHIGENKHYNYNTMNTTKKIVRLTESKLRNIISETVKKVLKETSLYYDEDNFSGRWSKNDNFYEETTEDVYAFDIDYRNREVWLYGKISQDDLSTCQDNAARYGNGNCEVDWYFDKQEYENEINKLISTGYKITNN